MENESKLPKRKHPRLDSYDYSTAGAYFITICAKDRRCIFSDVVWRNEAIVGRGFTPAANPASTDRNEHAPVGRCLGAAAVNLTPFGEIAKEQLLLLENRYPHLSVDQYVIMPNHIHVIFVLRSDAAGASPRPTVIKTSEMLRILALQ